MANVRNTNTYYIDTQYATNEELTGTNMVVVGVLVTATAANGRIVLSDATTAAPTKLDLRVATSGASQYFDFSSSPILFANGIRPVTLSNAVATVVVRGS